MHRDTVEQSQHEHRSIGHGAASAERRTLIVIIVTAVAAAGELIGGWWFGSMAVLADGWHMVSHAAALGVTLFAYVYARRHADDPRFTFGTGKVTSLGGFASAVALGMVAIAVGFESIDRLFDNVAIAFDHALVVAGLGLVINVVSALVLGHGHEHDHEHDHNLRSAYLHVVADALTSVLAIVALLLGKYLGWGWTDPAMGIVGGVLIARWAIAMLRETSRVLLDVEPNADRLNRIRQVIEADGDTRVADLHVWRTAPWHEAVVLSLVADRPRPPEVYKERLRAVVEIDHVTIEVNRCRDPECAGRPLEIR